METSKSRAHRKYSNMSDQERRSELLKRYPQQMLEGDDSYLNIYEGEVQVCISGDGKLIDVCYVANDRY